MWICKKTIKNMMRDQRDQKGYKTNQKTLKTVTDYCFLTVQPHKTHFKKTDSLKILKVSK